MKHPSLGLGLDLSLKHVDQIECLKENLSNITKQFDSPGTESAPSPPPGEEHHFQDNLKALGGDGGRQ